MDFTFNEEQLAVQEAADGLFAGLVTPDRVQEVEGHRRPLRPRAVGRAGPGRPARAGRARGLRRRRLRHGRAVPPARGPGPVGGPGAAVGHPGPRGPAHRRVRLGAPCSAAVLPGVVAGDTVLTAALADVAGDIALGGTGRPVGRRRAGADGA